MDDRVDAVERGADGLEVGDVGLVALHALDRPRLARASSLAARERARNALPMSPLRPVTSTRVMAARERPDGARRNVRSRRYAGNKSETP